MIIHVRIFPHNRVIFKSGKITLHITMIIITTTDITHTDRDIRQEQRKEFIAFHLQIDFGASSSYALSVWKKCFQLHLLHIF